MHPDHRLQVTHTDGNPLVRAVEVDAVPIAPSERYDVQFMADRPGAWFLYCAEPGHAAAGEQVGKTPEVAIEAPAAVVGRSALGQTTGGRAPPPPHPAKGRRWWRVALFSVPVLGFLGVLVYGMMRDPRAIPSPLVGKAAPNFQLTLFDGTRVRLSELRGKVVLLNFWASWCPPCRAEARLLEAAWRHYRDRGVAFLGVNIQDREASARGFLEEFEITYPNGRDPQNRIAIDYGVYGLPETFLISKDGLITYKHIGAIEGDLLVLKMEEALRGTVSAEGRGGGYQSIR